MSAAENLSSPIASAEHAQRQGPRRFGVPASPRRRPVRRWLRAQPHLLGRGDDAFSLSCASLKDGELLCSTAKRWRVEGVCGDAPGTSAKPRPPRVLVPTAAVVILSFPHLLQREPTRPSRCFGVLVTIETVFGARHMNSGVPSSFISVGFDFLTAKSESTGVCEDVFVSFGLHLRALVFGGPIIIS